MKDRFLAKIAIAENGCWNWTSTLSHNGYGRFKVGLRNKQAHRIAHELFIGAVPDDLYVLHNCDNRRCVNPDHLRIGTCADNASDRELRKRHNHPAREAHGGAKLTADLANAIRADSRTYRVIAASYGISKNLVGMVKRGEAWSPSNNGQSQNARYVQELRRKNIEKAREQGRRAARRRYVRLHSVPSLGG